MEVVWNLVSKPHATPTLSPRRLYRGSTNSDNSTSTIPTGYSQSQVDAICRRAEQLSSLTCNCGTSDKYPQDIAIVCKGPNGYEQDLVFDKGEILYQKTCAPFQETTGDETDLVCVTEYYVNDKPMGCGASINGAECDYCAAQSTSCANDPDGLTLRCQGYDTGSLCTNPDGSKSLKLVNFQFNNKTSRGGSGGIDPLALMFAAVIIVAVAIAKNASRTAGRSTSGSSANYSGLELSTGRGQGFV